MKLIELVRKIEADPDSVSEKDVEEMTAPERNEMRKILAQSFDGKRLKKSFRAFIPPAFGVLEPETRFVPNWHIDSIADHMQAIHDGSLRNLIINIPPRFMKSLTVSVLFPAWEWTDQAFLKYICASYGSHLSQRDAVKMRNLITSPWYRLRWGSEFALAEDVNTKEEFANTAGGYRISVGVGGPIPGRGGDRLIVDDAHKPDEILSDPVRKSVLDWWSSTMVSRVQDPKTVAKIIIAQRLHEEDLPGYLLGQGGWTHLCLPMEYEEKPFVYLKALPPIVKDQRTVDGELLWPSRFGTAEIAPLKAFVYAYSAQQQQRPAPAGGGLLKREHWQFYQIHPSQQALMCSQMIQSWDLAFKGLATSDRVACHIWGKSGANVFLIDRINANLDFPATKKAFATITAKWPSARMKLVEDKANGPAIISELRNKIPGLIAVEPNGTKEARAAAVSVYLEAHNVFLPDPKMCPWVEDFIAECASFPKGAHDDDVDAFTQALHRLYIAQGRGFDLAGYAALLEEDAVVVGTDVAPGFPVAAAAPPPSPVNTSTMTILKPDVLGNGAL